MVKSTTLCLLQASSTIVRDNQFLKPLILFRSMFPVVNSVSDQTRKIIAHQQSYCIGLDAKFIARCLLDLASLLLLPSQPTS